TPVAMAGVTSGDDEQVMIATAGSVLTGTAGDETVFTLEIAGGKAVLTLFGPLNSTPGGDTTLLDFSAYIKAMDGDGDAVALPVVFAVADGTNPSVSGDFTLSVDEADLPNGT